MISTSTFMALKLLAIVGLLVYVWRQSDALGRDVAEAKRRRAQEESEGR